MFQIGDFVFVEPSARIDIGLQAYRYITQHPRARIAAHMSRADGKEIPASEEVYALEWPEDFPGGIDCQGATPCHRGQFITAKHLSLDFEASRVVTTVPQIEGPPDREIDR